MTRSITAGCAVFPLVAFLFMICTAANADDAKTEKLKSAYLYNFLKFITWPDSAYEGGASTVVCTIGDSGVNKLLEAGASGKEVSGHQVDVRQLAADTATESVKPCHLIFITQSVAGRGAELIAATSDTAAITVGETEGFAKSGGTLNFATHDGKLRVELSSAAIDRAGVQVSAKLQQVSIVLP